MTLTATDTVTRPLRILQVWDHEYPWDIRTEKVCHALTMRGHDVALTARNRPRLALRETLPEATVYRLRPRPRLGRRLDAALMFPAFFNPIWIAHIGRTARAVRADVILCRELILAPTALLLARRLGLPFVLDLAEDYPGMLMQLYNRRDFRLINLVVRNPLLAGAIERWCVRRADGVMVVSEAAADRVRRLGAGRTALVGNTPTADRIAMLGGLDRPAPDAASPLRLVYLGLLETARGIDLALEAMSLLAADGAPVVLDLIGADHGNHFAERARSLGVADRVRFHGFVPHDDALRLMAKADVGLMPHRVSRHIRTTLPNKLFDYMAARLPVIATDAAPVRQVLETEGCGLVHPDRDAEALAQRVRLLLDPDRRIAMGRAGRRAVERSYNWSTDAARLCEFIEGIHSQIAPAAGSDQASDPQSESFDGQAVRDVESR